MTKQIATYTNYDVEYSSQQSIAEGLRPTHMITSRDIVAELTSMREQGYTIFSVVENHYCSACSGSGRIQVIRRGRAVFGTFKTCKSCNGNDGPLSSMPIVRVERLGECRVLHTARPVNTLDVQALTTGDYFRVSGLAQEGVR